MHVGAALLVGFVLGMRHATDADHVVAVGTLVRRESGLRGALAQGVLWGTGHTFTILAVGVALVFGRVVVPPPAEGLMELAVAAMLVALGIASLRSAPAPSSAVRGRARPVVVGIVHGLAGSAGVALLALTTIADKGAAMAYLAVFGAGTVAGMMVVTFALAAPFVLAAHRLDRAYETVLRVASVGSIALGLVIAVRVVLRA